MANKKQNTNMRSQNPMGHSPVGFGASASNNMKSNTNGKNKKVKSRKEQERNIERKERAKTLRSRQDFAIENIAFRKKVEDVQGRGTLDNTYYRLPEDKKPKKTKDHFFVARKFVCFLMFLFMLVSVAFFALSYLKLEVIPAEYLAVYVDRPAVAEVPEDGEEAEETEETEETEGKVVEAAKGTSVLDPVFGFVKYISNKFNMNIVLGESPLYDSMIVKVEVGMTDTIAQYIILGLPVAIILYAIIALVMMVKAFFGMFGRKVYKMFGLGSFLMIICGAVVALGGLTYSMDLVDKLVYKDVLNVLLGAFQNPAGLSGGYGLVIMIALPLLVLILSMFARKRVPYSIFDTISV